MVQKRYGHRKPVDNDSSELLKKETAGKITLLHNQLGSRYQSYRSARDSHNTFEKMHITFLENQTSTERTSSKTISLAKIIFKTQLCLSIAYQNACIIRRGWQKDRSSDRDKF